MQKWFQIATPHEDIREGDFDESVFAAKLGRVVSGDAPEAYGNAFVFFKKTYLTNGLEQLLQKVHRKLTDGKGPGVVQLQTPFGGGKTHALILLYHYLTSGEEIPGSLLEEMAPPSAQVAAVVGTEANPDQGVRSEGVHRRTLWGEIVYQLGGEEAFDSIASNDASRISPGARALREVLAPLQPFVILLDEVLEYIVRALGVPVGETTLGAQTLSFCQELTEAVSDLDRGMLVATLPSSEQEDFSESKEGNLAKLEKIFKRVEAIYTPVEGREVYSIIRQRLFEDPDEDALREVVDRYINVYRSKQEDLPRKVFSADYREKMELAYPFHPEVIDILYEKWSTFATFQRTRGALQLLARVAEDLWQKHEALDIIMPGDIDLNQPAIRSEFVSHLTNTFEGVIASDIAGSNAKAMQLDAANHAWDGMAQRTATVIFLHSFSGDEGVHGIGTPYMKLGVAHADTTLALVSDVLQKMENELWYLNKKDGSKYYFSSVPNLNRMVIDKKGQVSSADVRKEMQSIIRGELGGPMSTYLWPSGSDAIPDDRELKLVVLDPDETYTKNVLHRWVRRKGDSYRTYPNTIFFAEPDADKYHRFQDEIKRALALREILSGIDAGHHDALKGKRSEVKRRLDEVQSDFHMRVREMYHRALAPVSNGVKLEDIDFGTPSIGQEALDAWYRSKLARDVDGKILSGSISPAYLRAKFLQKNDQVSLRDVVDQFYKDVDLPSLDSPRLIAQAVQEGVRSESFGIVEVRDGALMPETVRLGGDVPTVDLWDDAWHLVTVQRARALKETRRDEATEDTDLSTAGTETAGSGGRSSDGTEEDDADTSGRTAERVEERVRRLQLSVSKIRSGKMLDFYRGVIKTLTKHTGEFTFSIDIDVESDNGIPKSEIDDIIIETLRQIDATVDRREEE